MIDAAQFLMPVEINTFSMRDAGFDWAWVERRTPRGAIYWREEPVGVPKIPRNFLDGVSIYIRA
jgi:hypothetical protein